METSGVKRSDMVLLAVVFASALVLLSCVMLAPSEAETDGGGPDQSDAVYAELNQITPSLGAKDKMAKVTLTFKAGAGGKVNYDVLKVTYGSVMTVSENTLTVEDYRITAIPSEGYAFQSWSTSGGRMINDVVITAYFVAVEPTAITKYSLDGNVAVTIPGSVMAEKGITSTNKLVMSCKQVTNPKVPIIPKGSTVYDVKLTYDGTALTSFSTPLQFFVKYSGSDADRCKVYVMNDSGTEYEEAAATYDKDKGGMEFPVYHLSLFVITAEPLNPTYYTITVRDDGFGTANTSLATAVEGDIVKLTATPYSGYVFKAWVSDEVTIVDNSFIMPAKNVNILATFEKGELPANFNDYIVVFVVIIAVIAVAAAVIISVRRPKKEQEEL